MKTKIEISKARRNGCSFRKAFLNTYIFMMLFACSGCETFLDIDSPKDKISPIQVFENDEIANSAITGIYSRMSINGFASGDLNSISVLCGLSADELRSYSSTIDGFYQAEISTNSSQINSIWSNAYSYIYSANAILEGLLNANGVSEKTKQQLEGESKFVRAFCYFYLINLFGDVPLHLTTDYRINEKANKTSKEAIYIQIISDLLDAETLLSADYVTTERIRPNKWAAKALLSRIYLYTQKWDLAVQTANEVINQNLTYELVDNLSNVFLKNSKEAIWQLMPPAGLNTREGALFILNATPTQVSLLSDIVPLFESTDNRKLRWIGQLSNSSGNYYYPFKYKIKTTTATTGVTEYSMVIRVAEIYLIRAEARAKLMQSELSLEDINAIRKRAGLIDKLSGLTSLECILEIEKQRRLELFSEWGHRWLDLKRTGRASMILASYKGSKWQESDLLYPIPDNEVNRNLNISQNPGY